MRTGRLRAERLPCLKHIVATGENPPPGMWSFAGVCALGDGRAAEVAEAGAALSPDDAIAIQFTSGTTGQPKGATLSHFNILNNGRIVGEGCASPSATGCVFRCRSITASAW
ncbi:MAG: AMP-binding protein [Rhizomicrobium sp.]